MKFIKLFEEISSKDVTSVGGKNASLGEMICHLAGKGVMIPSGFAIVADAYRAHLHENHLDEKIKALLEKLDKNRLTDLADVGKKIRAFIIQAPLPQVIAAEIKTAYQLLEKKYGSLCDVA